MFNKFPSNFGCYTFSCELKYLCHPRYRYVQTSLQTALDAGKHLSPSLGFLVPLPAAGGATDDAEEEPLLEAADDADSAESDVLSGMSSNVAAANCKTSLPGFVKECIHCVTLR